MRKPTDKEIAIVTLASRGAKTNYIKVVRRNPRRYLLLYGYMAVAMAVIAFVAIWPVFFILLGLLIGSIARDIGWIMSINNSAGFYEKVIDWDKVQAFADSD